MTDVLSGAKLMQVVEWGFPLGIYRPPVPRDKGFSVIHITGNPNLPSAEGEATWRRNDPAIQNSATFFVNRDGSVVQTLAEPLVMAPYANGDVNQPDRTNKRIDAVVRDGVNANTRTLVAIENVGYEPGYPLTNEQIEACARIIAYYHSEAKLPITRETVVGHYQLNSVTRPNCPGRDKSVVDRIVARANELVEDPHVIEDLQEKVAYWKRVALRRLDRINNLNAQIAELEATIKELEPLADTNDFLRTRVNRLRRVLSQARADATALAKNLGLDINGGTDES